MKITRILKNQKGSFSVIGIILTFIIVTIIAGYMSLNRSNWITSELQSIVDISSLSALNNSIDSEKLKDQIFAVKNSNAYIDTKQNPMKKSTDESGLNTCVANNFKAELDKQVSANDIIESITIKKCDSSLSVTDWGSNGSSSKKARPQLTLDAILQVVIKNTAEFDNMGTHNLNYKDARTGNVYSVTVNGTTKDGKVVLTVRTLSRIVYR